MSDEVVDSWFYLGREATASEVAAIVPPTRSRNRKRSRDHHGSNGVGLKISTGDGLT